MLHSLRELCICCCFVRAVAFLEKMLSSVLFLVSMKRRCISLENWLSMESNVLLKLCRCRVSGNPCSRRVLWALIFTVLLMQGCRTRRNKHSYSLATWSCYACTSNGYVGKSGSGTKFPGLPALFGLVFSHWAAFHFWCIRAAQV